MGTARVLPEREPYEPGKLSERIRENFKYLTGEGRGSAGLPAARLFLHSCCAPCSSYCLEYLCRYFLITVFYYNPNISFSEEYRKRVAEQKRLIAAYNKEEKGWPIDIVEEIMNRSVFMRWRRGMRTAPREESGVSAASICDCVRPRNWHRPADMTILPRPDYQPLEKCGEDQ